MRSSVSSSMQKTYDECYLTCSTAVYFESQNNEAEALRSWKAALDQIYYHNAHRVPSSYRPKSETEKALQDSLRNLELQCKERVDLLEALKKSREDSKDKDAPARTPAGTAPTTGPPLLQEPKTSVADGNGPGWLGGGTVPPVDYSDLYRPPLPHRPRLQARKSSGTESSRNNSLTAAGLGPSLSPVPTNERGESRTPSPEKKGRMLRTLRPGGREGSRGTSSKMLPTMRSKPPAAAKAATQAWGTNTPANMLTKPVRPDYLGPSTSKESLPVAGTRSSFERSRPPVVEPPNYESFQPQAPVYFKSGEGSGSAAFAVPPPEVRTTADPSSKPQVPRKDVPSPSSQRSSLDLLRSKERKPLVYRNEYPQWDPHTRTLASSAAARSWTDLESNKAATTPPVSQSSPSNSNLAHKSPKPAPLEPSPVESNSIKTNTRPPHHQKQKNVVDTVRADLPPTTTSDIGDESATSDQETDEWKERVKSIMKNLPKSLDETAAQQILNEIVIQGDEVHWDDVAGLDVAKSALKENVVYPFLRPDLFMGLREPARGMLLFGPPGTGKTMLARAVATESHSTFFAISASSLTSKFLGESEKLVRALFGLAKLLAPSIIFVDEIDSLLSSRSGSGEHEASRRIKTEFLIQWSDLQKAAAGREATDKEKDKGDASRVLVLAATNLPWAIDEAARRRFVRRQYIPLPEPHVRKLQLRTLLSHQKHELGEEDMDRLVELTDGFSGSDITALAKDAAMGPLRSLGEQLLHTTIHDIPPMNMHHFEDSLRTIRPSVSKQGLKEYEDWAQEFGERGG